MIEPKELRIGSLIFCPRVNQFLKVSFVDEEIIWARKDPIWSVPMPISEFEPIPITPELLERCGYQEDGFHCFNFPVKEGNSLTHYRYLVLDLGQGYLWIREGKGGNQRPDDIIRIWSRDRVKEYYLHQLQNLYFVLAGEELNINL